MPKVHIIMKRTVKGKNEGYPKAVYVNDALGADLDLMRLNRLAGSNDYYMERLMA